VFANFYYYKTIISKPLQDNKPWEINTDDEEDIFTIVEEMPVFNDDPTGKELKKYISQNTNYPNEAKEKGIVGRVFVRFVIDVDGSVINSEIARGINHILDNEALRVINSMPKWRPGFHSGKPVKVYYLVAVYFGIPDN